MNHGPHLDTHLSDDELIAMLYGLGDTDQHLAACPECDERWNAMHRALGMARAESAGSTEISARRLAAQRQQILDRLQQPPSLGPRWVPVAAAASLLAVAMFLHQRPRVPARVPPTAAAVAAVNAEADSELFTDVYSMERDVEPKAVAPIRALFQDTAWQEERQ